MDNNTDSYECDIHGQVGQYNHCPPCEIEFALREEKPEGSR